MSLQTSAFENLWSCIHKTHMATVNEEMVPKGLTLSDSPGPGTSVKTADW